MIMKGRLFPLLVILLFATAFSTPTHAEDRTLLRHDLKVTLYPTEHRLVAEDSITLPDHYPSEVHFLLHKGLNPTSPTQGVRIIREHEKKGAVPIESFKVTLTPGAKRFVIRYAGTVHHPLASHDKEYARGFRDTPGIISDEGVYLEGSSLWYPIIDEGFITFHLDVTLPPGWDAVSQGARTLHSKEKGSVSVRWESPEPQEEIYLVAARFSEYTQTTGRIPAMVFLRTPDRDLANKYLEATARYIAMYEKLIGPYPYAKFALIENFWETGFGMPSFTLLGPKIIRFPFIITSSYPHEILHTWWGNSVFPDYRKGNWSEGLTAYLSDHLIKEQQGNGVEYRQTTLQKYADYVQNERDFPLTGFRSRHSSSSEAVGYGKSLMLFHMLRRELGDATFAKGLQDFYREQKFKIASFDDLQKSFERVSGKNLGKEFDQWLTRTGAPKLKLVKADAQAKGNEYLLSIRVEQTQKGDVYRLHIPLAVTMEGQDRAYQTVVRMDRKQLDITLSLPSRPLRIDVDPEFDIFRRLDIDEIPPAITQALGAKSILVILPSSAPAPLLEAYRDIAKALAGSGPDTSEVKLDKEIKNLPSDRAIAILGWENRFADKAITSLSRYGVIRHQKGIRIEKTDILFDNHAVVLASRNPGNKNAAMLFIASDRADALPGLGRKLPHYHKYSYLGFEGDEPANIAKGRWPVLDSPMTLFLPDRKGVRTKAEMGKLAARAPLAVPPPVFFGERMKETVRLLSGDDFKGRGFGTAELDRAAEYIADQFKEAGLVPGGDTEGSYIQQWQERGGDPEQNVTLKNIIGIIPGKRTEFSGRSVVIAAHYDHLGLGWPDAREGNKGKVHPGADDNASGVAVLIELARVLGKALTPDRSVIFVAFSGEEAGRRGSKYYVANQKRYPAGQIVGMVNLDTVGRLGKGKLLVLGVNSAKEWIHIFRGAGFVTGVEIEAVSERIDASDQVSFEEAGVPAVQLSSGPHLDYHRPTDTADKIDIEGLVKVATVAKEVIEYLSSRTEPMTATPAAGKDADAAPKKERKISLGTIPDFAFSGKGCRLTGVVPGSPAEICGLKEGDVITKINSREITGLRDLSDTLKSLTPGSRISVTFIRDGNETVVEAEVVAR